MNRQLNQASIAAANILRVRFAVFCCRIKLTTAATLSVVRAAVHCAGTSVALYTALRC